MIFYGFKTVFTADTTVRIVPVMQWLVLNSTIPTVRIRVFERVLHCYMYTIALNMGIWRIESLCTGR